IPFADDRVRLVFAMWRQLIDQGYFIDNHATLSWQEAQAPMFEGNAAMYLIGNFITPFFDEEIEPKMGFFQFPAINPDIELAEDARRFLAFMTRPDIQVPLNETIGNLPTNNQAPIPDDRFLQAGSSLLNNTKATAQFYDRDTDPEMAKIGMQGFQEFMVNPDQIDRILEGLEAERQRIFEAQG
ncbi:MAG: carbohydrate ABC transporter substrate-binding protein, partial [Geminicoccaceae bacterium]